MNGIRSALHLGLHGTPTTAPTAPPRQGTSDDTRCRKSDGHALWRASRPFVLLGGAAIIAGGLVAAAVAHQPVRQLVWLSAYLVLIVGVVQIVFGTGQAWLLPQPPSSRWVAGEWLLFNLGNAGVVAGTLAEHLALVCVGAGLLAASIALFAFNTRDAEHRRWLVGYRALLGLIFVSSLIGLGLSAASHVP